MPMNVEIDPIDHLKGKAGGLKRFRQPDDPELLAVEQQIVTLRAERTIRRLIAERPAFTGDQVQDLTALIRSCGGNDAA